MNALREAFLTIESIAFWICALTITAVVVFVSDLASEIPHSDFRIPQ